MKSANINTNGSPFKHPCVICEEQNSNYYYEGLIKCNHCGFIWADINLSYDDLVSIYGKDYFFGDEYADYLAEETILKYGFRKFNNQLLKLFNNVPVKPKLLEIGSAYGFFLDIAKENFCAAGVEISSDAAAYSRNKGHQIFQEDLSKLVFRDEYDIVVSFATLEHLVSPDLVVQQIFNILKPNGYCYISTIDIGSFFARFRGKKWRMIHPPTHLNYFSSASLKILMEKNGFHVLECNPIWQYRSLDAVLLPKFANSFLYKLIKFPGLTRIPIPFNFGDIIGLLAQKYE